MPDVFSMLENDHRKVEDLLEQLTESEPGAQREELVAKLLASLQLHMTFEEESIYPLLAGIDGEMEEEAEIEHGLARDGLSKVTELVGAPGFGAAVEMLQAGISHHVEEEEQEAFPKLRSEVEEPVAKQLADALVQRKAEAGTLAEDLQGASKADLLEMAADAGVEGRSSMTKDDLIAALTSS